MDPLLSNTIERTAQAGKSRFSNWQPALFQATVRAGLPRLWARLEEQGADPPTAESIADGYVRLIAEAIGLGHLSSGDPGRPANLVEYCLGDWLVGRLGTLPPDRHLRVLAETWNLLEGLMAEPRWVGSYVLARSGELDRDTDLEPFLVRVLQPLFESTIPAAWDGPFRVSLLSMRAGDEDFLPGDMQLVAPCILSVQDRLRDLRWAVVLRKEGKSELAGRLQETSPYVEPAIFQQPRWDGGTLRLGSQKVRLPYLERPTRWLQTRAGFVVATAADSQKLWIVESDT